MMFLFKIRIRGEVGDVWVGVEFSLDRGFFVSRDKRVRNFCWFWCLGYLVFIEKFDNLFL